MTSTIPGPQAAGKLQLMSGRLGATLNDQRRFFENQLAILRETPIGRGVLHQAEGNFGVQKSDWSLSDHQEAVEVIAINNLVELLTQAEEETWYYYICPVRQNTNNALTVKVIRTFFRPQHLQEAAPRTTPRNLDIQQSVGMQGLSRYIGGFEVDSETLLGGVEKGVEWFAERVAMMRIGQLETEKFWIISTIMSMHKIHRVKWNDYIGLIRSQGSMANWINRYIRTTFSACKDRAPLELMIDTTNADFRVSGVPLQGLVTIVHESSLRLVAHNTRWYSDLNKGGRTEYVFDGPDSLTTIRNQPLFAARNFLGPNGHVLSPLSGVATIGLFYPMVDRFNGSAYRTNMRTIKITDVENMGMHEVQILDALWRTRRWHPATRKLVSLVDQDAFEAKEELRKQALGQAEDDAFHTYIERPAFNPDTPYLGPATHWGSVKVSTFPTDRLLEISRTIIDSMLPEERNAINNAIEDFVRLVAQAGAQSITSIKAYLSALAGDGKGEPRPDNAGGCRSVNPQLRYVKFDEGKRFADAMPVLPKDTGGADIPWSSIPAGFGTLAGMSAIKGQLAPDLQMRVSRIEVAVKELVSALKDSFPSSVLLDPSYAASHMLYATAEDMITTMAVKPNRPVLIYQNTQADANADGANKVAFDTATALWSVVETFVKDMNDVTVYITFKPVNTESLLVLYKKSMAMTALLNFSKNGADFVVKPDERFKNSRASIGNSDVSFDAFARQLLADLGGKFPRDSTPYSRSLSELRSTFEELKSQFEAAPRDTGKSAVVVNALMTPLVLEPSQVIELARLYGTDGYKGWTIGQQTRPDWPASRDELQRYADALKSSRNSSDHPVFGHPLTVKHGLSRAHALYPILHVGQIRDELLTRGIQVDQADVPRPAPQMLALASAPRESNRRQAIMNSLRSGADSSSSSLSSSAIYADPSGSLEHFLGCMDSRVDLMFNTDFVQRWHEINSEASTALEVIIARLYATTPTDWDKSIKIWAKRNVRLPVDVFLDRVLRVRTNPFVRILPGERTMFLERKFERTMNGTDHVLGMTSVNHSVYAGIIVLQENNCSVTHSFAPAGYISGMGPQWAEENGGIGLTATLVPGTTIPSTWSPLDDVRVESSAGADIIPLATGSASIRNFEMLRRGRVSRSFPPIPHPDNKWGEPIHDPTVETYFRDTTLLRGDGSYRQHVASSGMLLTSWATDGLRHVLDGVAVDVNVPLNLSSADQVSVSL